MRLTFLLAVFGLVAKVFGDTNTTLADEYTIVYYWYAYVVEYETEGKDPALIAPGCSIHGESPICYFDEFVRFIQRNLPGEVPMSTAVETDVGEELHPSPASAAKSLLSVGYRATVDASKLLPAKFSSGAKVAYSEIMAGIEDVVSTSKTTAAAAGTVITDALGGLTESLDSAINYMMEDLGGAHISAFGDWCTAKACSFSIVFKTVVNPDGSSYKALDTDAMIKQFSGDSQNIIDGVSEFLKDFNSESIWPTTPDGAPPTAERVQLQQIQSAQQGLSNAIEAPHCS